MKHAVIFAHPAPRSYTRAVAQAYAQAVRQLGDEVIERDLYGLGFDPRLPATELPGAPGYAVGAEILAERALLAEVDVFALVYPFWFNAPPAMLKGYVDRVFSLGFGFLPSVGGTEPGLRGRQLVSLTSSGAPEAWVRRTGAIAAIKDHFDGHIAEVCGLSVIGHYHAGEIAPDMTPEAFAEAVAEAGEAAKAWFGPEAP